MISEGSCDTEDWANDAEKSVFLIQFYFIFNDQVKSSLGIHFNDLAH